MRLGPVRSNLLGLFLVAALSTSACDHAKNYVNSDVEPISAEQLRPLRVLVDSGALESAEAQLVALCEQHPNSVEARRLLQDARRSRQSSDEFVLGYREAVRKHPGEPIGHYLLGRALIEEPGLAKEQFEKAAALDPLNPWPTVGLAYLSRARGDFFATVATYRAALLLAPRSARLRWFLGTLYLDLRLLVDAQRELAIAERLDPDNPRIWGAQGRVQLALGNVRAAGEALVRSRVVMPEQAEIYVPLAELYLRWRCPEQAIEAYQAGLDLGVEADSQLESRLRALELVADESSCQAPSD